ncbi:MAG: L,D-transpeptidase [Proteobacteria bacterium]|nr:L,D-transpeptidase [Pseudomonadota bacterium]
MASNFFRPLVGLFLFGFFLLTPGLCGAESAESSLLVPEPLLYIEGSEAIIVEKNAHRLYFYDSEKLVKDIRVTTGKRRGNKQVVKDLKTPEGVYFLLEFLEDADLPSKYGARAIVLDYPNPIDKFQGKTGSGIWIHGTDDPPRLKRPYDSRGCVVMLNDEMLALADLVTLNSTPVVIVKELKMISKEQSTRELQRIARWFEESFEFGFDSVEELKVIKFDTYNVVSFVKAKERRIVYFKERDGGYELSAAIYDSSAAFDEKLEP